MIKYAVALSDNSWGGGDIQIDAALMAKIRARAAEDGASLTATVAALLQKSIVDNSVDNRTEF